ncbi:MAG: TIGR03086 family metal-binding protein [Acidimicrobiales bacterium]
MSEPSERYRRLAAAMTDTIEGVPDDGWDAATPCEGWTVKDLVGHLVDTSGMFLGFIDQSAPPGPSAQEDPAGAFAAARDAVQRALDDPETAAKEYDGMFGRSSFADGVDGFLSADLVVHRWDLARATGQDETLPADEVERVHAELAPMDDKMRGPGAFGPKVEPPPGADAQTQLLCFLGRHV